MAQVSQLVTCSSTHSLGEAQGLYPTYTPHLCLAHLEACGRDDDVSRGLDPRLPIHLHRRGLEERDAEVGALGNADPRAQSTLHLALRRSKRVGQQGP